MAVPPFIILVPNNITTTAMQLDDIIAPSEPLFPVHNHHPHCVPEKAKTTGRDFLLPLGVHKDDRWLDGYNTDDNDLHIRHKCDNHNAPDDGSTGELVLRMSLMLNLLSPQDRLQCIQVCKALYTISHQLISNVLNVLKLTSKRSFQENLPQHIRRQQDVCTRLAMLDDSPLDDISIVTSSTMHKDHDSNTAGVKVNGSDDGVVAAQCIVSALESVGWFTTEHLQDVELPSRESVLRILKRNGVPESQMFMAAIAVALMYPINKNGGFGGGQRAGETKTNRAQEKSDGGIIFDHIDATTYTQHSKNSTRHCLSLIVAEKQVE